MQRIFALILCFSLLFFCMKPNYDYENEGIPSFGTVFSYGYSLTFGLVKVGSSIFKGPDTFFSELENWQGLVLGYDKDNKPVTFVSYLDGLIARIPILNTISVSVEEFLKPMESDWSKFVDWVKEKF